MIEETIAERGKTHGHYASQCESWGNIMDALTMGTNWEALDSCQKQALTIIAVKMSRILEGDHKEPDHWKDIAGYAMLVHDWLKLVRP